MSKELLSEHITSLNNQKEWLSYSLNTCLQIGIKEKYSREEFDKFETLTSRFARTIDFLIRKVFRTIDDVEFESQGTLIDTVNRANKKGLFDSIEMITEIKDIRNDIVHEYVDDDLINLFEDVLNNTPNLIEMCDNTINYCKKYL